MRSIVNEDPDLNPFSQECLHLEQTANLKIKGLQFRNKYPNSYMADQGLKVFKFERDYNNVLNMNLLEHFLVV